MQMSNKWESVNKHMEHKSSKFWGIKCRASSLPLWVCIVSRGTTLFITDNSKEVIAQMDAAMDSVQHTNLLEDATQRDQLKKSGRLDEYNTQLQYLKIQLLKACMSHSLRA